MKKVFAFATLLALVLSLAVPAFAAGTGSITITNAILGDDYKLFKIFDATYSTGVGGVEAVSYSIDKNTNQFFAYMFGTDGTQVNTYFTYDAGTGAVVRKDGTQNSDIINYLTTMVRTAGFSPVATQDDVTSETVVFSGLPYGYYLIDKGIGAAVTIDSNTPDVSVIDKNQHPAVEDSFKKLVWDEETMTWVSDTSASIGDVLDFKVEFIATNYDGENQIKYYAVKDTKGSALWVEFNDITVKINGTSIGKGYYHCAGDSALNTGEWTAANNPTQWSDTEDGAAWYLIHYGYDEFDIVIPWMSNHDFTGTTSGYTLAYGSTSTSKYDSPVNVTVEYSASVEPSATIGGAVDNNLWNTADLSWTSTITAGPDDPSTTTTKVYALGLEKVDADDSKHLAGAVFEVYRDMACTDPVYVIPTNIKGVYILDDLTTIVSGANRETSRQKYAAYLEAYLGASYATTQKNVVTTEVNGKLVILGLEAGDYYLKETKAPDGYNTLATPVMVSVGSAGHNFFVIADAAGKVVDELSAIEGYTQHNYTVTSTKVENSKGVELPSTGGEGTAMMITIGTMIAMGFAVLLITHKKMSVYQD